MDKFRIKAFITYLFIEPWTSKVSLPNLRSISWGLIFASLFFRNRVLTISLMILGLVIYLFYEYQTGRYIYWYRMRMYKNKKALKGNTPSDVAVPTIQLQEKIDGWN